MSSTSLLAPCAGRVVAIGDVPDPVFAQGIVGPGVALDPGDAASLEVVSPLAGRVVKVHPHAFVVLGADGVGVLVHLGLDTVRLEGRGFEVLVTQGSDVRAGEAMIRWDLAAMPATISTLVPVAVLDCPADRVTIDAALSGSVAPGDPLLSVGAAEG